MQVLAPRPIAPIGPAPVKTTLGISKLCTTVPESVMTDLLRACGGVKSCKLVSDPDTGKHKGFGFADYEDAEGVLRALRLLNGLTLDGQQLVVKPDSGTQRYIDEYVAKREAAKAAAKDAPTAMEVDGKADSAGGSVDEATNDAESRAKVEAIASARNAVYDKEREREQASTKVADEFLSSLQGNGNGTALPGPPGASASTDAPQAAAGGLEQQPSGHASSGGRQSVLQHSYYYDPNDKEAERRYRDRLREWERHERVLPRLCVVW